VLDDGFVAATVSSSLALPERRQGTIEQSLIGALRAKRLLVVLDNCEQVIGAVAALVDTIIESCPGVMVLATSREALGVEGETTYELRPLPTPPSDASTQVDSLMSNDAIRLFVERARAVKRGFALTSETAPVVAELCQRLDGIPLAIELAAARLQLMAPAEVLARLDERFRVLAGGRRTALERHQTLRGAIDWSYALLGPAEQLLFARLSVFVGGFTLGAAEAVASGEGVERRDALSVLGSLVAKSMVVTDDIDAGTRRYRLLDTLRAYASERLGELDDPVRVRARHAGFFLELAETAAGELKGPDDEKWYLVLNSEEDNIRAALGWARDQEDPETFIRLVHGLALYWYCNSNFRPAYQWHRSVLQHASAMPTQVHAELLGFAGLAANGLSRVEESIELFRASLERSRASGLPPLPLASAMLGIAALESGRPDDAIAHCDEAVAAARRLGDRWYELEALQALALACSLGNERDRGRRVADEVLGATRHLGNGYLLQQGLFAAGLSRFRTEPENAVRLLEDCQVFSRTIRSANQNGQASFFKGLAYLRLGRRADAAEALRTSLPLMQETGGDFFTGTVIAAAAGLMARSAPEVATQLLGALDRFRTESRVAGAPDDVEAQRQTRSRLEQSMEPTAFADAWSQGSELSIDEAAALAHDELGRVPT
jgi:predicted ATPase